MNNFDLDGAIALWRERLSWREAFTDADLDEMESHLRDGVDSLVASGITEQGAFYQTTRSFDEDMKLAWRFNQANWETVMIKRTAYAPIMLGNYFKVAVRNLLKHKIYSFINIVGLAVGIACSVLIFLFVQDELSYDRFHEKADRIYRVALEWNFVNGDPTIYYAMTVKPLADALLKDHPEIEQAVRIHRSTYSFRHGVVSFYEKNTFFVDPSFFGIFSFPLLQGNPKTALQKPFSIVLTEKTAQKYFGDQNPIGQELIVDRLQGKIFTVTGILSPVPKNSHFVPDILVSFETFNNNSLNWSPGWGTMIAGTYVLLAEGANPNVVDTQIADITQRHQPGKEDELGIRFRHFLQPLTQIHLHSHLLHEFRANSDIVYMYLFSLTAMFILIIACINFINLTTARSIRRAKEVGLRKVVGAHRRQLILQFLGESLFITCVAFCLSIFLIEVALPFFNVLAGKELTFYIFQDNLMFIKLLGIVLIVGLLAGSYPAFLLSGFKPVKTLKGVIESTIGGVRIRKGLVTIQFVISIVLIISTVVVYAQLDYMQNQKLGFDQTQLLVLNLGYNFDQKTERLYQTIKTEFLRNASIHSAAYSWSLPGRHFDTHITSLGDPQATGRRTLRVQYVDSDFFKVYDIKIIAGKSLSQAIVSEDSEAFMLNETAVKQLGWGTYEEAINKKLNPDRRGNARRLIGVVQDFHYQGLQKPIEPLYIQMRFQYRYLALKIRTENLERTIDDVKMTLKAHLPNQPFEYIFLDEEFGQQYRSERRLGQVFGLFSMLAVFIASLGLLGLISFTAQQRTKEIGIRKVLGASVSNIIALLTKDFVQLILLANLIAWPVAYYALNKWLQDFAYRTTLSFEVFLFSGLAALLIAVITIGHQAFKAARANPVDALHYE